MVKDFLTPRCDLNSLGITRLPYKVLDSARRLRNRQTPCEFLDNIAAKRCESFRLAAIGSSWQHFIS